MRACTTMRSSRMPSLARQLSTWKAYLESWEGIDSGSESTFAQNRCNILPKITSTDRRLDMYPLSGQTSRWMRKHFLESISQEEPDFPVLLRQQPHTEQITVRFEGLVEIVSRFPSTSNAGKFSNCSIDCAHFSNLRNSKPPVVSNIIARLCLATCILYASRKIVRNPSVHLHHVPRYVRAIARHTGVRRHASSQIVEMFTKLLARSVANDKADILPCISFHTERNIFGTALLRKLTIGKTVTGAMFEVHGNKTDESL